QFCHGSVTLYLEIPRGKTTIGSMRQALTGSVFDGRDRTQARHHPWSSAAERTADGLGVALWLPPGVRGNNGPLEAIVSESIAEEKQADVDAIFERTDHCRPTEPHWYLSLIGVEALHRNKGCGRLAPAPPSPMRSPALARLSLVIQSAQHLSLREAW